MDHHTRCFEDILPVLLQNDLPALPKYLESRLKQTYKLSTIKRAIIKEKNMITGPVLLEDSDLAKLITNEEEIRKKK